MNSGLKQSQLITQARDGFKTLCEPSELLFQLRNENPGLQLDDAYVVPSWFVQQTTWLEDPSSSDSAVYNYPLLFRIRVPLGRSIWRRARCCGARYCDLGWTITFCSLQPITSSMTTGPQAFSHASCPSF